MRRVMAGLRCGGRGGFEDRGNLVQRLSSDRRWWFATVSEIVNVLPLFGAERS